MDMLPTPAGSPIPEDPTDDEITSESGSDETSRGYATDTTAPRCLTYEALVDFCRNDEHHADLSEYLRFYGHETLRDLLEVWWCLQQAEGYLTRERLWLNYVLSTAVRLYEGIRGVLPLATLTTGNLTTALLTDFATQTKTIANFADSSVQRIPQFCRRLNGGHRKLFEVMEDYKLGERGHTIFAKYGYLDPDVYHRPSDNAQWVAVPASQLNFDYVDPQSEDFSPPQVNGGPIN
jgi:hypothetical protein